MEARGTERGVRTADRTLLRNVLGARRGFATQDQIDELFYLA